MLRADRPDSADGARGVPADIARRTGSAPFVDNPRQAQIELVAIQTLKKAMLVTRASPAAAACLAEALASRHWSGTMLIGVSPSIREMAERYAELSRRRRTLAVRLRVFQLDRVVWPKPASGTMRPCQSDHREILARFVAGFEADTPNFAGRRADRGPIA